MFVTDGDCEAAACLVTLAHAGNGSLVPSTLQRPREDWIVRGWLPFVASLTLLLPDWLRNDFDPKFRDPI